MNRCCRYPVGLLLLALTLVAASSVSVGQGPVFLARWGSNGSAEGQFNYWAFGIAVDNAGYVYAADTGNHRIQKFDSDGNFVLTWGWGVLNGFAGFQTCASGCQTGVAGSGTGQMDNPHALAVSDTGYVYVSDAYNSRIVKFDSSGNYQTQWGSWCDVADSGYDGCDARFQQPWGVAVDADGKVYVADLYNERIQVFDSNGTFITKWGSHGSANGQFNEGLYVAVDAEGSIFVADNQNYRIQKFTLASPCPSGTSQVVAGVCFVTKWGSSGTGAGEFVGPAGMAVDTDGNLYVADFNPQGFDSNERIQKFDGDGNFILEWGSHCSVNDVGIDACDGLFWKPTAVAVDGPGNIYVLEIYNDRIQKFGGPWLDFFIGDPELSSDG